MTFSWRGQDALGVPQGSVRATVLIETIMASFQMEDILYELRDHSAGLNAGRWDYIFSLIKTFRTSPDHVLPDRVQVTMAVPFMRAYTELLVRTCHKRGAHAIGGMAAFIPSRRDPEVNKVALAKVREDKEREANAGYDGTWLAHPDLVPIANEVFDAKMGNKPNQKDRLREDVKTEPWQLVDTAIPGSSITEDGLRMNVSVGMQYIDSWLRGNGAAAINNLMEDAATAEISRAQIWQWIRTGSSTSDGEPITIERYRDDPRRGARQAGPHTDAGAGRGRARSADRIGGLHSVPDDPGIYVAGLNAKQSGNRNQKWEIARSTQLAGIGNRPGKQTISYFPFPIFAFLRLKTVHEQRRWSSSRARNWR